MVSRCDQILTTKHKHPTLVQGPCDCWSFSLDGSISWFSRSANLAPSKNKTPPIRTACRCLIIGTVAVLLQKKEAHSLFTPILSKARLSVNVRCRNAFVDEVHNHWFGVLESILQALTPLELWIRIHQLPERLRGMDRIRNPWGFARTGSNPVRCAMKKYKTALMLIPKCQVVYSLQ